ncbi:MAG TPA: WecB/TagA/CpsF family glycosyltransferase [Acidobacteriaceae bacterium]|jgi:N-acetylglucosaminyldiphosphoundecaprenol N-acetyl-beta-D-mannosaminyltransferase
MTAARLHHADIFANVLGIGVHAVDMDMAIERIRLALDEGRKGYVCLAGVHGIMEARRHPDLRAIFANAWLVAPDGMPTVWMGHLQGLSRMRRVFGPDLMLEVIGRKDLAHCRHFLCGGEPGVAEQLRDELLRRFPWACIVGTHTPPFRPMTAAEEHALTAQVQQLRPDIIWVGLSTPKQDRFMARYLPVLETKLMIGVGAAFLFHTGAIQDSPAWVKQAGLQWLHRLVQEPSRLWRRYLVNVPLFLFQAALQISGLCSYSVSTTTAKATSKEALQHYE